MKLPYVAVFFCALAVASCSQHRELSLSDKAAQGLRIHVENGAATLLRGADAPLQYTEVDLNNIFSGAMKFKAVDASKAPLAFTLNPNGPNMYICDGCASAQVNLSIVQK